MPIVKMVSKNFDVPNCADIDVYVKHGGYSGNEGYSAARKVVKEWEPKAIIEEVKVSGVRGRGGAGFPAGMKWSFVPADSPQPKYLCVNADEGEPGTFKDRHIMARDPHLMIEGVIIASRAINCHHAYIYIRGEFVRQIEIVQKAVDQAYAKGFLGKGVFGSKYDLDVTVHRGAGAYICGEETGLIESLEGKKGQPRLKPPFPAIVGLFQCPTVVNNVETLATLPYIFTEGGKAHAAIGTEKSTGTKLVCVSGHVARPGLFEIEMGTTTVGELIELAGGVSGGRKVKAVIPGGSSVPVMPGAAALDAPYSYEGLQAAGSLLGSGGMIVFAEGTCMVRSLQILLDFYHHESCGQCTPCREGTGWIAKIVGKIERGEGTESDLAALTRITGNMSGTTICALADAAVMPTQSFLKHFRGEFEAHVREKRCPVGGALTAAA